MASCSASYVLLTIVLMIITMNIIVTQSKFHLGKLGNLKPKKIIDDMERNTEKLLIVFNGTCANSIDIVEQKVQQLLESYLCLSKWEGIHKHHIFNISGIYETANGDYNVYFTINDIKNEISCIESMFVNHENHCIRMIDYEVLLQPVSCKSSSVYSYPLPTYYRWNLDKIDGVQDNTYKHLDTSSADGNVDVYVLDSGILSTHYEFGIVKSYTLLDSNYSTPQTGHGTHVAGIIAGRTCGISNHHLFDYPVCRGTDDLCYSSYISDAFAVILNRLSTTKRRGVINMSFGTTSVPSDYYKQWYNSQLLKLINAGAIPIAAAGNDYQDACASYPAGSPYALGIGSYNIGYNISSFSNYGSCVDIYAPGDGIVSSWFTSTNSYAMASGTSMATPAISGIVADALWNDNTLTFDQIKSFLQQSSNNINLQTCPSASCKGIKIDCNSVYNAPPTPTTTTAKPTTTTTKPTTTTVEPTIATAKPTPKPTVKPTSKPTVKPTSKPTSKPTVKPTSKPTVKPTSKPTAKPTTAKPTTTIA